VIPIPDVSGQVCNVSDAIPQPWKLICEQLLSLPVWPCEGSHLGLLWSIFVGKKCTIYKKLIAAIGSVEWHDSFGGFFSCCPILW